MISKEFSDFKPFLLGKGDNKHFIVSEGELCCIRESCEGCNLKEDCEFEEGEIQTSVIPSTRRGIGFEEKPFLILILKEGLDFSKDVPQELWDNPYSDKSLYEANLHFILSDLKAKFRVMKGQFRYYGNQQEFEQSKYSEYFKIFSTYDPCHHVVSMDFSAIEPKISTIVSREPEWLKIFEGTPKVISKKLNRKVFEQEPGGKIPSHLLDKDNGLYCYLEGELDKVKYEDQCNRCKMKEKCQVLEEYQKNIPGDWHSLNAVGLFGDKFTKCVDKFEKKEMRSRSKIIGLALTYDGSSHTVSNNLEISKEAAQVMIDNFFKLLSVERNYMLQAKRNVLKTGKVYNLFGRSRDVSKMAFSAKGFDRGYAQRTALNHPIQSTGGELLKISKIRINNFILEKGLNPYFGQSIRREVGEREYYNEIISMMMSTIHDEVMYGIHDKWTHETLSEFYPIMQTKDIIKSWGINFDIELDCEYDPHRSWTATKLYSNAKIFLTKDIGLSLVKNEEIKEESHNTIEINFKHLTREIINKIVEEKGEYKFIVNVSEKESFIFNKSVSLEFIKSLDIPYRLKDIR